MKKYAVLFNGSIDIEAESPEQARDKFLDMDDATLGACVEEYDEITEVESSHDPRTCENSVPCADCADAERPREYLK